MNKILYIGVVLMGLFSFGSSANESVLGFSFDALMSKKSINLSDYKGKVVMIVNTASKCGLTGQYDGLEKIYKKYQEKGLIIIGVPSNDFGKQEPGTAEEIAKFCKLNYGVSFPMAAKYSVKGDDAHPFYKFAREKLGFGTAPKWNFHKYIIDKNGDLVDYFNSTTKPTSARLIKRIESLLSDNG